MAPKVPAGPRSKGRGEAWGVAWGVCWARGGRGMAGLQAVGRPAAPHVPRPPLLARPCGHRRAPPSPPPPRRVASPSPRLAPAATWCG